MTTPYRLSFLFVAAGSAAAVARAQDTPPNLVFIMADQWRGQALGCLGVEPVVTPNLDRFASESLHYTDAVSSYPVSSPARGMLMTGRYPLHTGVPGNCNSENTPYGVELPDTARCWSDVLAGQGYELGYIGKWHLDAPREPYVDTYNNHGRTAWNEWCPPERRHGFGYWMAYGTYDYHLRPMYWDTTAPRDSFTYVDQWGPEYEADRAIDYIRNEGNRLRDADKPFALVVSMNPPHTGYELVPQKYKDVYRAVDADSLARLPHIQPGGTKFGNYFRQSILDYYACMTGVDEQVGRILEALEEAGLAGQTIVVFTSDHGDSMGMHENIGKDIYYEEAMRIPMMIRWPGKIPARRDSTGMMAFADLAPTLLSLMGFKEQIPAEMETYDWSAAILSPDAPQPTDRQPYYKVLPAHPDRGFRGWRTPRYTFAVRADSVGVDSVILFDRYADPYQMHNVASGHDEEVRSLWRDLEAWLERTGDPFLSHLRAAKP